MKKGSIIIHGERLILKDFKDIINSCCSRSWKKETWFPTPALIFTSGTVAKFIGQDYDPAEATLDEKAWDHDHCEICGWKLNEKAGRNIDYTDADENWLCSECYTQLIVKET